MNYLSVCSGIEAASVAWEPLGFDPVGFSEIDPFCCDLLNHRYQHVQNYGSLNNFPCWPALTLDILVGGTPCQAFSVAGLRQGLADPRGNLTLVYLACVAKYRPTWIVWENVPGVLTDKTGAFRALLAGLSELGYGWAYRVLDAQYVGGKRAVPQRRRRVFLVGHSGGSAVRAAKVLFEPQSLRRDLAPRKKAGEEVTGTLRARAGGGCVGTGFDLTGGLQVANALNAHHTYPLDPSFQTLVPVAATVRRLTPRECERLQGFPDDYTNIPGASDSARYKALGNSMAVNVMQCIGNQLKAYETNP